MLFRSGTRPDRFSVHARILPFPGARPDSTNFWYSHSFYHFSVFARAVFRYSHGFYLFPVLTRILPLFGTHTNSTFFRNSSGQSFNNRTDSTFSRYSPGFYHFQVRTLIFPLFDPLPDSFSVLARILPFPGTRPNFRILWYSH